MSRIRIPASVAAGQKGLGAYLMVDEELISEIDAAARELGDVYKLSEHEVETRVDFVMNAYVGDPEARWWWSSLKTEVDRISYGEGDGLNNLVRHFDSDAEVMLVVTDDEFRPWPAYKGKFRRIISLLREVRFFEYFVISRDGRCLVFDTHLNELIIVRTDQNCPPVTPTIHHE